jgi:hypothetical protein
MRPRSREPRGWPDRPVCGVVEHSVRLSVVVHLSGGLVRRQAGALSMSVLVCHMEA